MRQKIEGIPGTKVLWTLQAHPKRRQVGLAYGALQRIPRLTFHMTQVLTGNGRFQQYLHRMGRAVSAVLVNRIRLSTGCFMGWSKRGPRYPTATSTSFYRHAKHSLWSCILVYPR
ncbi:unnamed protein product [Macrosiphum euphorbiae]|uniref:Uncharacterized protein n=1 Tax=Macrosiphum euphorbiae TaxID=13131 RepID=A0AAV0W897_9HEMI|nr:unnamed protein product [Macrosiphum euphorbiae]